MRDIWKSSLERPVFEDVIESEDLNGPYLRRVITRRLEQLAYNPDYGDTKECKCGHLYYRHFDSWENYDPIGCKYCDCRTFEEKQ